MEASDQLHIPAALPLIGSYTIVIVGHQNSAFCPQRTFMGSVWFLEETVIISLNSINRLFFLMKISFYEVRTGVFRITDWEMELRLHGGKTGLFCLDWLWSGVKGRSLQVQSSVPMNTTNKTEVTAFKFTARQYDSDVIYCLCFETVNSENGWNKQIAKKGKARGLLYSDCWAASEIS